MENKLGTKNLETVILFVITLILTVIDITKGRVNNVFKRIAKGLLLVSELFALSKVFWLAKEEVNDLNEDEINDLAFKAGKELDIMDTEVAYELTKQAITLIKNTIDFVEKLTQAGKIKAIVGS